MAVDAKPGILRENRSRISGRTARSPHQRSRSGFHDPRLGSAGVPTAAALRVQGQEAFPGPCRHTERPRSLTDILLISVSPSRMLLLGVKFPASDSFLND